LSLVGTEPHKEHHVRPGDYFDAESLDSDWNSQDRNGNDGFCREAGPVGGLTLGRGSFTQIATEER
jgi:hypothetical protein